MIARNAVDGYEIEVDTTGRSYGKAEPICFVRYKRFCAPLEELSKTGELRHSNGKDKHCPPAYVIGDIEAWVRSKGYPI